jgi:hypothetical protein
MGMTYLGSETLSATIPLLASAAASIGLAVGTSMPQVSASIAGIIAAEAQIALNPPTLAANISVANQLVVSIQAAIDLGLELPSLSVQLGIMAAVVADLTIQLGILQAQVDLAANILSVLATGGVHLYVYDGVVSALGSSCPTSLPGGAPTDHVNALILATSSGATWSGISACMKVS